MSVAFDVNEWFLGAALLSVVGVIAGVWFFSVNAGYEIGYGVGWDEGWEASSALQEMR